MTPRARLPARVRAVLRGARRSPLFLPGALAAAALLAFYGLSAATRVGGGDWGQFQTFGYMGGIPHSPGYPLLTGSIYLATRLARFAEPAHTANVVNAVYAAAAGTALFLVGSTLARSRLAGACAAVVFATGYSIWEHAAQAGMMSVQTLLVVVLVGALLAYDERPSPARLALVGFATGLSLTNHGVSVFMLPATAVFVASRRFPGIAHPRTLAAAFGACCLGLLPWLYVVRGLLVPVPRSRPENIDQLSPSGLVYLIFGKPLERVGCVDAITSPLDAGRLAFLDQWPLFVHDVLREFGWVWLGAGVLGWLLLARRRARLALWMAWTGLTTIWYALTSIPMFDGARYFVVVYALLAVCLAAALGGGLEAAVRGARRLPPAPARYAALAAALIVLAAAGLRAQQQLTGPARVNVMRHRENAEEQAAIGLGVLRHMEPGSVFFTNWTSSWYPRYAAHVNGLNRDISIQTADFGMMDVWRAEEILSSGRRLYLQRVTPAYETFFTVEQRGGVFWEVSPPPPERAAAARGMEIPGPPPAASCP